METFNITVKCDSEIERDIILDILSDYLRRHKCKNLIRFGAKDANVYFSENEEQHFMEKKRVIT